MKAIISLLPEIELEIYQSYVNGNSTSNIFSKQNVDSAFMMAAGEWSFRLRFFWSFSSKFCQSTTDTHAYPNDGKVSWSVKTSNTVPERI